MKYSHKASYDHDLDADATTTDKEFAFCRKIINEDIGFTHRYGDFLEFGHDYTDPTLDPI